jgi:hypothetical protein
VQYVIRGTRLKTIQKVMGHQDIRTTEMYIPLANELAKKELEENPYNKCFVNFEDERYLHLGKNLSQSNSCYNN